MTTQELATSNYNINKAIYDPDEDFKGAYQSDLSENFLAAHGTLDPTMQKAIRVTSMLLNNYNLTSKIKALHPFLPTDAVTATLDNYKWNLVNPANTNAAHRIAYNGNVQALSAGLYSPGISGDYASLNFNFATDANNDDYGITVSHNGFAIGKYLAGSFSGDYLGVRGSGGTAIYMGLNNADSYVVVNADSTIPAIITGNRVADNLSQGYNNGVLADTGNTGGNINPNQDYILFGLWNGSHLAPSEATINFHVIHDALTATETYNLYRIISIYKTIIGR